MGTPAHRLLTIFPVPGTSYLLLDRFDDNRAAGAVHGTPATPGPGTRVVTDTESKVTTAAGVLNFSGGKASPGYGDPGVWWDAVTRVAGRVLLQKVTLTNAATIFIWGFDDNQAGNTTVAAFITGAGPTLKFWDGGAIGGDLATLANATPYTFAIVLRAAGAYLLVKGGAFLVWTLLSVRAGNATATLYPTAMSYSAAATVDDVRISDTRFVLPVLAYDTFTRANGALGVSEIAGPDGQGTPQRTWTGATWTIATNKAVNTPTTGAEIFTDPGMEGVYVDKSSGGGGTVNVAPEWDIVNVETNGTDLLDEELVIVHGGTSSQKIDVDAVSEGIQSATSMYTAGNWYCTSFWVYIAAGSMAVSDNQGWASFSPSIVATTGSWTQVIFTFRGSAAGKINLMSYGGAATFYIDDVSIKLSTLSTLFASCGSLGTPDVLCSADLVITAGTQAGVVTNLDSAASPANFLIGYHDGTNAKLVKCVGGTYTNLISAAATYVASATLRVVTYTSGANLMARLYYNSVLIGSEQSIGDAGIKSNTICGTFSTYVSNTVDAFTVLARGTEGQYAALEAM